MTQSSPQSYLENQILTATPQELRRMLIDGALRFARQASSLAGAGDTSGAEQPLHRVRAIIAELIGGITNDDDSLRYIVDSIDRDQEISERQKSQQLAELKKLSQKTMGLYVFLFQEVTALQMEFDTARLNAVIDVLQLEAETADLVCQQMPEAPKLVAAAPSKEVTSSQAPALTDGHATYSSPSTGAVYGGEAATRAISFEA